MSEISNMRNRLVDLLKAHQPLLRVVFDSAEKFEVSGTVPTMQGKKKVDGIYFASVIPKPKDVRLYFFPIYTHRDQMPKLSPELQKCLKGKSCFHIKKLEEDLENEIAEMIKTSVAVYQKEGLL